MSLPVCGMEQEIVEAVHSNDVIILCGETGSGKSQTYNNSLLTEVAQCYVGTQVPQFLYESGYGEDGSEFYLLMLADEVS